jgi:hypothetical protein
MYTLSLELIKMVMNSGAGTLGNGGESVQKPIAQVNRPRAKRKHQVRAVNTVGVGNRNTRA